MSKEKITLSAACPTCGSTVTMESVVSAAETAPTVRCGLRPAGVAYIYQITSDQIEVFIQKKARSFVPDIKVVCTPITGKDSKKTTRKYAFMKIAFSDAAIACNKDASWYEKLGEGNIRMVPELFGKVVQKYKFNRDTVSKWLKDYRYTEYLETFLGITTPMLEDIKEYSTPKMIKGNDGSTWITFAAAPENIIHDMLSDIDADHPCGKLEIVDTQIISKGQVSYTIHVYPNELPVAENAAVRSILLGDNKN